MTIEERLLHDYGETEEPSFATWMLKDGTMVNGTVEGRQRDVDHRCISEYFKRSKFESPGSAYIYVKKFMNRGNIRMCCNEFGYNLELRSTPTLRQIRRLIPIMGMARRAGLETLVEWHPRKSGRRHASWSEYLLHLALRTSLAPHLSQCL